MQLCKSHTPTRQLPLSGTAADAISAIVAIAKPLIEIETAPLPQLYFSDKDANEKTETGEVRLSSCRHQVLYVELPGNAFPE